MNTYTERDLFKLLPLQTDDDGATWHPIYDTQTWREGDADRFIPMQSLDGGNTWVT